MGAALGASDAARAQLFASEAGAKRYASRSRARSCSRTTRSRLDEQIEITRRTLELGANETRSPEASPRGGLITDFDCGARSGACGRARSIAAAPAETRFDGSRAKRIAQGADPPAIVSDGIALARDTAELPPAVIPEGLPSDLLLRRPDIVEAEQRLIAANARIGVARAASSQHCPYGLFGSDSASLGDLLTGPARIWQLAFALSQPISRWPPARGSGCGHRTRAAVARAISENGPGRGFGEVRESLVAQARTREVFAAEEERVAALRETLRSHASATENGLSSQARSDRRRAQPSAAELNRVDARARSAPRSPTSAARWRRMDPAFRRRRRRSTAAEAPGRGPINLSVIVERLTSLSSSDIPGRGLILRSSGRHGGSDFVSVGGEGFQRSRAFIP